MKNIAINRILITNAYLIIAMFFNLMIIFIGIFTCAIRIHTRNVNLHKFDVANITRIFYIISAYFKILHKRGHFYVV